MTTTQTIEEQEVSAGENTVMDLTDYTVLRELNSQKSQLLQNIGALEEMKQQHLKELEAVSERREKHSQEIQKKYKLPDGKLWRVMEDRTIQVVDPSQIPLR